MFAGCESNLKLGVGKERDEMYFGSMSMLDKLKQYRGAVEAVMGLSGGLARPAEQIIRVCWVIPGGCAEKEKEVVIGSVRSSLCNLLGCDLPEILNRDYWVSRDGQQMLVRIKQRLDENGVNSIRVGPRGS